MWINIIKEDELIAEQILKTQNVSEIKKLGKKVENYNEHVLNGIRQIVVYVGLLAKFSQNDELKKKLKETKKSVLVECAVKDRIWGIVLSMKDSKRLDMTQWKGQNLLGYALMEVRKRIEK